MHRASIELVMAAIMVSSSLYGVALASQVSMNQSSLISQGVSDCSGTIRDTEPILTNENCRRAGRKPERF
jgi:hypothetical protein